MRKTGLIVAVVVAVGAALFFALNSSDGDGAVKGGKTRKAQRRALLVQKNADRNAVKDPRTLPAAKEGGLRKRKRGFSTADGRMGSGATDGIYRDEQGKAYPAADQQFFARADKAIENDDVEDVRLLAADIAGSTNRDLREKVIEALGWFGEETLAEMTPFLSDKDEKIAEKAHDEWVSALQSVEDDGIKAGAIELALGALADKSMIEDVANELVGIDELAAIQVIANIMDSGSPASAQVKETYETITGEEWSGVDAAEAWLQENYEIPDAQESVSN